MSKACEMLHRIVAALPRYNAGFNPHDIPANGVYFLFEKGEHAHNGERIVRVGTHTGQNNLPQRLMEHLLTENKDRSILRKHIGRCLLNRKHDPFASSWEIDLTEKANRKKYPQLIDSDAQAAIEREVSLYMMESFTFSVISLDKKEDRLNSEKRFIGTLFQCKECVASSDWLGKWHTNHNILSSGIWNIQGQNGDAFTEESLQVLVSGLY